MVLWRIAFGSIERVAGLYLRLIRGDGPLLLSPILTGRNNCRGKSLDHQAPRSRSSHAASPHATVGVGGPRVSQIIRSEGLQFLRRNLNAEADRSKGPTPPPA